MRHVARHVHAALSRRAGPVRRGYADRHQDESSRERAEKTRDKYRGGGGSGRISISVVVPARLRRQDGDDAGGVAPTGPRRPIGAPRGAWMARELYIGSATCWGGVFSRCCTWWLRDI